MRVAIIDYGSGNLRSAAKAFERASADHGLGAEVVVTDDAATVRGADRIVLPGVGAFADCKAGLAGLAGMVEALEAAVTEGGRPFMGICVGMQLMAERGREYGVHEGLGWIAGDSVPLEPSDPALKIPHMGWNDLRVAEPAHPVLAGLPPRAHGYFVHGYHVRCADPAHDLATVDYGGPVAAVIGRDNLIGCQFHPEKSQAVGQTLIAAFLRWRP
ncbi:MAG: imidazole glycerol phosphate synthase subunit HisH [Azospirillaceae bacterium]